MSSNNSPLSLTKIYGLLTTIQSTSAALFTTFTLIHGAQVLSVNMGGVRLGNNWILMGRPFYQDERMEGILVTGSATAHILAGIGKQSIRQYWNRNKKNTNTQALLPYHHTMGYMLIPLVGLHYYLVRSIPIDYYGDSSFIDFAYIAWGLQNKPVFTYGLHIGLATVATYHIISGLRLTFSRLSPKKTSTVSKKTHSRLMKQGVIAGVSVALISSLFIISKDTKIPLRFDFIKMYSSLFI